MSDDAPRVPADLNPITGLVRTVTQAQLQPLREAAEALVESQAEWARSWAEAEAEEQDPPDGERD
jgi:hypothetical protein